MTQAQKPAYWAVLPAKVRYDEELRPNAKLLYAEITALADMKGYCWAGNEYLAQLYGLSKKTVSDLISTLVKKGYLKVEIIKDKTGEITERRIMVDKPTLFDDDAQGGIPKIKDTPIPNIEAGGIPKNGEENNTSNNNNKPPIVPQGGRRRRELKRSPDWMPERFNSFWKAYPRGESKQTAIAAWDRLKPDEELLLLMGRGLKRQMQSEEWQRGIGIPYAATWLNQRRWEDEARVVNFPKPDSGSSWADDEEVRYV